MWCESILRGTYGSPLTPPFMREPTKGTVDSHMALPLWGTYQGNSRFPYGSPLFCILLRREGLKGNRRLPFPDRSFPGNYMNYLRIVD